MAGDAGVTDDQFLHWVADRFVHVIGESENVDFVQRLRRIATERGDAAQLRDGVQRLIAQWAAAKDRAQEAMERVVCAGIVRDLSALLVSVSGEETEVTDGK